MDMNKIDLEDLANKVIKELSNNNQDGQIRINTRFAIKGDGRSETGGWFVNIGKINNIECRFNIWLDLMSGWSERKISYHIHFNRLKDFNEFLIQNNLNNSVLEVTYDRGSKEATNNIRRNNIWVIEPSLKKEHFGQPVKELNYGANDRNSGDFYYGIYDLNETINDDLVDRIVTFFRNFVEINETEIDPPIAGDIGEIINDTSLPDTEKKQLIKTRLGQGQFRQNVIKQWKEACAVTGCNETSILIASHIKPWKVCDNQERLDPYNGLLLSPNVDKLFDMGLISFADNGDIIIWDEIAETAKKLGVTPSDTLNKDLLTDQHRIYLQLHRKYFDFDIS